MAQLLDLALHVVAGEARLADSEAAVELQPIDDIAVAGRQQELGDELQRAGHRGLGRVDRHLHDVFDAGVLHVHIEPDFAPLFARRIDHAAMRHERGAEERRVDFLQQRVAIGAVDDRVVLRMKRKRMSADRDREVGRLGVTLASILASVPPN